MSSFILAFETSGEVCSVALVQFGHVLAERHYRHELHLSERLLSDIDDVLNEAGVTFERVDTIAVGLGPGSFTGTRIGVMTAKTLAAVSGKLLVGVSSLQAIAAAQTSPADVLRVPLIPSRGGTAFTALYRMDDDDPQLVGEPAVLTANDLADAVAATGAATVILCGPSPTLFEVFASALAERSVASTVGTTNDADAVLVARRAEIRLGNGDLPDDAVELVPLYVSQPSITIPRDPIPTRG